MNLEIDIKKLAEAFLKLWFMYKKSQTSHDEHYKEIIKQLSFQGFLEWLREMELEEEK